jgi:hypothetical protein
VKLAEILFLVIVSACAAALCLHGWLVEDYAPTVILPPAGIALVLAVLAGVRAWLTLTSGGGAAQAALQAAYWRELRGSAGGLLWCLAVLPLLLLLGYPLGLTLSAAIYARFHGAGWGGSLLAGGFAFAVCWGLAGRLLGVPVEILPGWLT